ncbi:MAG TPA: type II toxin-antitoxin system Phd/YefM family antitoxin [Gemmatimonadaceae bacterium]|nr:type II toxin-antitoxin system Phd/YefM family antitoxin [Gemmatimonadaceae bacterium]
MSTKKKVSETARAAYAPGGPAPRVVQASTFKATCLELMDEIQSRHLEVVVTKHGRPVVKVVPVEIAAPSPVGFLHGTIVNESDIVSPDHESWRASPHDPLDHKRK